MSGLRLPPLGGSLALGILSKWDASVSRSLDVLLINQLSAPQRSLYWLSQAVEQAVYDARPQGQRQRLRWSR